MAYQRHFNVICKKNTQKTVNYQQPKYHQRIQNLQKQTYPLKKNPQINYYKQAFQKYNHDMNKHENLSMI